MLSVSSSSSACSLSSPASGGTRSCTAMYPGVPSGRGVWGKSGGLASARKAEHALLLARREVRHRGRELLSNGCHVRLLPGDLRVVSGPSGHPPSVSHAATHAACLE